jgi:hypothetical protein
MSPGAPKAEPRMAHKPAAGAMGIGIAFATKSKLLRRSGTNEVTAYVPDRRLPGRRPPAPRRPPTSGLESSGPSTRFLFTRVSEAPGLLRVAEPMMEQVANGQIDHDLGALKELLAVTRKPASAAKGWQTWSRVRRGDRPRAPENREPRVADGPSTRRQSAAKDRLERGERGLTMRTINPRSRRGCGRHLVGQLISSSWGHAAIHRPGDSRLPVDGPGPRLSLAS